MCPQIYITHILESIVTDLFIYRGLDSGDKTLAGRMNENSLRYKILTMVKYLPGKVPLLVGNGGQIWWVTGDRSMTDRIMNFNHNAEEMQVNII